MKTSLTELLKNSFVDGVFHTHVSMIQPCGKYMFNREKQEKFWEIYCEMLENDKNVVVGIAEKPQQYLPVLVDVDLKIRDDLDIEYGDNLYTYEQVKTVIQVYQSVLRYIVDGCTDDHLLCVLLEKPMYFISTNTVDGEITYIKQGIHLTFPNLFLNKIDQEVHLIPRVQMALTEMKLFENLGYENSGKVIDGSCCKVPWLVYGSRKSEDMDPYLATKVYNYECAEVSFEDAFKYYKIYDIDENPINIRGSVMKYLPRILSIIVHGRQTQEIRSGLISPLKEKLQQKKMRENVDTKPDISVEKALAISKKLLPMLADYRAEVYDEWMTIGWVLYNISNGCQEGLEQWMEFSAKCKEKYDESSCIYEWSRMVKKDLSLGTLRFFANKDNPEEYDKFKHADSQYHAKQALEGSHNDIARMLYAEYGNEFVCASISNKIWFQFRGHKWEEIEEGVFLRERISSEIADIFAKIGSETMYNKAHCDKAEEAANNVRIKQVGKLVGNLKSANFKSSVMKEAMEVFYDRKFREKLNKDQYLIAFQNGVYDLRQNILRNGRPEDYISKALPIDYIEYNESDEPVQNVLDFLRKIFPDSSVRTYFLDMYSDIFVGGNNKKVVLFWTGDGDNGKSKMQEFLEKMLGELSIKFDTTLFTGKKTNTGSAAPELARAGPPVRLATMEEPDNDEQINVGYLKKLSGGDSYWARDLFEKGKDAKEVTPFFLLTFICNKLPKLKYSDAATWNRIRVIPFESTFVRPGEPCPETHEDQMEQKRFPMDKDFSQKIPNMIQAFAWYLLKWRQKPKANIEPPKVLSATAMYRKQNDIYRQFIEECITEDDTKYISLIEIYAQFKEWFKEGFPAQTVPIKNEVKEYFERIWGEPEPGVKWQGYRIRTLQDGIENGNIIVMGEEDLEPAAAPL